MAKTMTKKTEPKDLLVQDKVKDLDLIAPDGAEEHLSQEELEIPFLKLAQKGSPQVDKDDPKYIEGLEPGMYFNTASEQMYGDTLKVQVHGYYRNFTIWKGPKGAGEFNGSMTPEEFKEFEKKEGLTRDGGDFVQTVDGEDLRYRDTRNFIISLPEHTDEGIMVYPMSSTGIKAANKWNTLQNGRRVNGRPTARYATLWEISSDSFRKDKWSWHQTSRIKALGWASNDLLEFGKEFVDFVAGIKAQGVKYDSDHDSPVRDAEDSDF